jgi:hypothetical protein
MSRIKIPSKTLSKVIFDADRECCVCNKRGHQIHHLNGKNDDNAINNLVFLCLVCHHDAEVKGGLGRKLDKETILLYREQLHEKIQIKRENSLKKFSTPIKGVSTEDLLTINKNAIIIIELRKIEARYFNAKPTEQYKIFDELSKFSDFTNTRVAVDVFDFLLAIANQTRSPHAPKDVTISLLDMILIFFPYPDNESENEKIIELAQKCIQIAFAISYDTSIYLNNLYILEWGLTIYKYIYRNGKVLKIDDLKKMVLESYDELESTLKRPERNDLGNALWLVKEFRKDLDEGGMAFPSLPQELMHVVYNHEKEIKR